MRFMNHLTKCMRNYESLRIKRPDLPEYVPCKNNWRHHVPRYMLEDHLKNCPDAQQKSVSKFAAESPCTFVHTSLILFTYELKKLKNYSLMLSSYLLISDKRLASLFTLLTPRFAIGLHCIILHNY